MGLSKPLDYSRPERADQFGLSIGLGIGACVVGIAATVWPLQPVLSMQQIPVGTIIRPMNLTFLMVVCAGAGLLVAFPLTATCLMCGWRTRAGRLLGIFGLLFAAAAVFLNFRLFSWIVATRGLVLD